MRRKGCSIGEIERKLQIPRSTLSGWLKEIKLSNKQKSKLLRNSLESLGRARKLAIKWHHLQKKNRLLKAQNEASSVLAKIDINNRNLLEIALALLYMGEGNKKNITSLGNTNPMILSFFIKSVEILYKIDSSKIMCDIHLRSDQNANEMVKYWSRQLNLPKNRFTTVKDKRIVKSKTYSNYMGVCVVRVGNIAILRRLGFIGEGFCTKIASLDA